MVHSLNKGKGFERVIAKLLTNVTGVKWMRVPMSGAFATLNETNDPRFKGDVFTEEKAYNKLVIECKATKNRLSLEDISNKKSLFWQWVKQSKRESKGLVWLLFFKANHGNIFCVEPAAFDDTACCNYGAAFSFTPVFIMDDLILYKVNTKTEAKE